MVEIYIVDGKPYEVSEDMLQEFFKLHPTAIKQGGQGKLKDLGGLSQPNKSSNTGLNSGTGFSEPPEDDTSVLGWFNDMGSALTNGYTAGRSVDEAFDIFKQGDNISDADLDRYIKAADLMSNAESTSEEYGFQQALEKNGGGFLGGMMALYDNMGYAPQFIAKSAAMMVGSFIDSDEVAGYTALGAGVGAGTYAGVGAVAASVGGPIGTFLGGFLGAGLGAGSGAITGLVGAMETGLTLTDLLRDELEGKSFTSENIRELLKDKETMERVTSNALARGLTIGMVEGLTMGFSKGVGSKVLSTAMKSGKKGVVAGLKVAGATTAVEMAGGGLGELGGQIAADQEISGSDIFLEMIGEAKGAINTVDLVKTAVLGTKYTLSGEEVSLRKIREIILSPNTSKEALANMEIEVKGDKVFENFVKASQAKAVIDSQIDVRVSDLSDRKKLVELELKRQQAERNIKKKGVFKVLNADNVLENIEGKIDAIVGKYGAVDIASQEVVDRQSTKENVAQVVGERNFKAKLDFAKKHSAIYNLEVDDTMSVDQIEKYIKDNKLDASGINADGFIHEGKIIINTARARLTKAVNVGNHELLHGILRKSMKKGQISDKLINNLKVKFGKQWSVVEAKVLAVDKNGVRLYDDAYLKQNPDEWITMLSDAIQNNEITFDDSVFTKIGDLIAPILRLAGFKKIGFENAQSTYNFLKEYNRSIHKGSLSKSIIKKTGGDVSKMGGDKGKFSMSVDNTSAINELASMGWTNQSWKEQGADFAIKEMQSNKMLDGLIRSKYKADIVPDNFVDLVYSELVSHVKNFKPESNDSLFGWINSQISNKAGNVYNREFKVADEMKGAKDIGKTTKEGEVKVQVAAETDSRMEALETEDLSPAAQAKKKADKAKGKEKVESKFRRQIGIETGSDLYNKVLETARKSLLRAYEAGTSVRNIQRKLRDEANVYLFKDIKNFLGTTKYISNLKEFRVPIMNSIFTADLVQMERNTPENERVFTRFVRKLTSKEDVQAAVDQNLLPASALNIIDKGTAVSLYEKANPTEAQFMSYFDIPTINPKTGARSGTRGTRKDQLAKNMAGSLSYDATMQVAQEPDVVIKREQLAALKGETLAKDNLEVLAAAIGRDPSVKFAKTSDKQSLSYVDKGLYDFLLTVKDNKGTSYRVALKELINNNIYSIKKLKKIPEIQESLNKQITLRSKEGLSPKPNSYYLEQHVINNFASLVNNDTFVKLVLDEVAEGVNPDVSLEVNGMTLGVEVKADSGRGPARTIYLNIDEIIDGKINIAGKKGSLNPDKIESLIKKTIPGLKKIKDLLSTEFGVKSFDLSTARGQKQTLLTEEAWQMIKKKRLDAEVASYVWVDSDFVSFDYVNKEIPSFYINMGNAGLFTLSNFDPLNTGAKSFSGVPIPLTVRIVAEKKADGMRRVTLKVESQLDARAFEKQGVNLFKKEDVKKVGAQFSKSNFSGYKTLDNAVKFSRSTNSPTKGITVLDFDDTLATSKSLIRFTRPDGTKGTLNAEQYASTYQELTDLGYKWDFSEFTKVVDGKTAPLFNKAMKLQGKFGPENMFVLTARPAESAAAIHAFLKANGLNIPLKNITGLANSTAEAKALWMAGKVGEGYNDFYFADDALQNVKAVKNMLDQLDVKSKVQQARVKFSKSMDPAFNEMLERTTGVPADQVISQARATKRGSKKGRLELFVPPSAEDFLGLLYKFVGKGEQGNADLAFLKQSLIDPLNRAYTELNKTKQAIADDYRNLKKLDPETAKKLRKQSPDADFTYGDAVRVYLWNKSGIEVPGLSETDKNTLSEMVTSDPKLQQFADQLGLISRQEDGYVTPGEYWQVGDIRNDLDDATSKVGRKQFFTEFIENSEIIFSQENLQKIEAIYGSNFREALENILYRTKTGSNKSTGSTRLESGFIKWINGSVAATMFVNTRSALLQTLSSVNFTNWGDNNPYKMAKAFANQKQFWADFSMLFNSAKLKQRRSGLGMDINANELTTYMAKSKSSPKALLNWLLQKGFLPTQMADSFAISIGGASFYRNRVNTYLKQGMDAKQAEEKAFQDFSEIAEATQQSARPDMVSQQQASPLGKFILNFQNTPMQYTRLIKKATIDLIKGRGDIKTNISRIVYYGAVQNMIFYGLQTALFAMMFSDDEEDEEFFQKKKERVANGMVDSLLRGTGIGGAAIATAKNMIIKFLEQKEKGYNKDESAVLVQFLNFSPVVGIKAQKIVSATKGYNYNEKVIDHMSTFDINNPVWSSVSSVVEGTTNIPLNRLHKKVSNVRAGLDAENEAWQRLATLLGFSTWDVGIENREISAIKEELKAINKVKKKNKKKSTNKFKKKTFKKKSF